MRKFSENMQALAFFGLAALLAHVDRLILGYYAVFKTHDQFDSFWVYQIELAKRILSFQLPTCQHSVISTHIQK